MADRVERQPAEPARRLVAQRQGCVAVRDLVERDRNDHGNQKNGDLVEDVAGIHRAAASSNAAVKWRRHKAT